MTALCTCNRYGLTSTTLSHDLQPRALYVASAAALLGHGYCQRETSASDYTLVLSGVPAQLVTALGKVCAPDPH